MIDTRLVGYNRLIPNKRQWNNCYIKNNQELLLDLADFALKDQPEDNLMVTIPRAWYNGSYTTAAKPIKSLELHYTMIQFLIIQVILKALTTQFILTSYLQVKFTIYSWQTLAISANRSLTVSLLSVRPFPTCFDSSL